MERNAWSLRSARGDDRGSALIAALAVAFIGMALAMVVVAQAILTSNDSGRDRARTVQVHGAEGAVDATFAALEIGTPCRWPATGTSLISTAPDQTGVSVTIRYYDAASPANLLSCTGGHVAGTPATAIITATADTTGLPGSGIAPHRTIEAKVQLTPQSAMSAGAAIYSANAGALTNYFTATSADVDTTADIWIDSGNVDCNSSVNIDGNLYVPAGNVATSNNCTITKDLRVQATSASNTALQMNQGTVQGNVWVYKGNAVLNGSSAHIGGNLTTSGTARDSTGGSVSSRVGGAVQTGWVPPAPLARVPLPHVGYVPGDWAGFGTRAFAPWAQDSSKAGSSCKTTLSSCYTIASKSWSIGDGQALTTTIHPMLYDARGVRGGLTFQNTTLVLNADTAIFADSFAFTNTVNVKSGDGNSHKLWIIVPWGSCSGSHDISVNSSIDFNADPAHGNISTFLYTPCTANISNVVDLRGQIYGGKVVLQNNLTVQYDGIGIPGVSLSLSSSTSTTFRVGIVYKREIAHP